jgi:hypothetical protein
MDNDRIYLSLGRLEGKMDACLEKLSGQDTRITAITDRVDKLESHNTWMAGATAVVGGIIGTCVTVFCAIFGGYHAR